MLPLNNLGLPVWSYQFVAASARPEFVWEGLNCALMLASTSTVPTGMSAKG